MLHTACQLQRPVFLNSVSPALREGLGDPNAHRSKKLNRWASNSGRNPRPCVGPTLGAAEFGWRKSVPEWGGGRPGGVPAWGVYGVGMELGQTHKLVMRATSLYAGTPSLS